MNSLNYALIEKLRERTTKYAHKKICAQSKTGSGYNQSIMFKAGSSSAVFNKFQICRMLQMEHARVEQQFNFF